MKDKLIELIEKADETVIGFSIDGDIGILADYLLAEGVIVLPCKVGDDIYWIDAETNEIHLAKADIKAVCYYGDGEFKLVCGSEKEPEEIGTKWCMLTREEAERALQKGAGNDKR